METNIWDEIIHNFLVQDDTISEIQSNGGTALFCRKNGRRMIVKDVFGSPEELVNSVPYLIKKINPNFLGDARELKFLQEGKLTLSNGNTARVHIMLPPTTDYPSITIAKKTVSLTTLDRIYANGSMSSKMRNFIQAAVSCKFNIIFSGSTGAGKTTMLEAATKIIPPDVRIGVVEDSPELSLQQPNVVYLHTFPWKPGMDPNEEVTLDWCVKQINRMRTDLLIIGETRGKEFKEFITAANSGMEGSMSTLHANTPKLALSKMTQFIMEAQPQPVRVINESIANTIDVIIQLTKTTSGEYKVVTIEEISRTLGKDETAKIATTELSRYDERTKMWSDKFLISDHMRRRFESRGYDCSTFTKGGMYRTNGLRR